MHHPVQYMEGGQGLCFRQSQVLQRLPQRLPLCRVHLPQRQPQQAAVQPQHGHGRLDRDGVGLREEQPEERAEPPVPLPGGGVVPRQAVRRQPRQLRRSHIGGHADHPVRSQGHHGQGLVVVAAVKPQRVPALRDDAGGQAEIPAGLLDAVDIGVAAQLQIGLRRDADGRAGVMAEGGLIDWTAHSQDLAGTIFETLDFDEAIAVAYAFYQRHPKETLIVVTADHETGGIALGRKGYNYDLTVIDKIKNASATTDVEQYMNDQVSIDSVNEEARIGWTTTSHSGGPVPVWAIGTHAQLFAGRQDNTDIPKKICAAMGVQF